MYGSGGKILETKSVHSQMVNLAKTFAGSSEANFQIKDFNSFNILKNDKKIFSSNSNGSDVANKPLAKIQFCDAYFFFQIFDVDSIIMFFGGVCNQMMIH
jgi:hypothetical protein